MFTLLMNCVKYLFILWLRVLQYSDLWSGIIIAISRVICSNLAKSQQWEETDLAVSGGVGLSSEEERDVGGQVGRPTEGVRTEPEAKHASLAGLGHSASLYSWRWKIFWAIRDENISELRMEKIFLYFSLTFSLHSHLEAFLQSAVLTLVPDKKVTSWLTDWREGDSTCDVGQWDSSCYLCTDKLDFVWQTAWRNSYSLKLKDISQLFPQRFPSYFSIIFQRLLRIFFTDSHSYYRCRPVGPLSS